MRRNFVPSIHLPVGQSLAFNFLQAVHRAFAVCHFAAVMAVVKFREIQRQMLFADMMKCSNLSSLLATRTSPLIIPCAQLPELGALAKSIGATLCTLEVGHRVSAGTDKNGRPKSRRDPTGYTVGISYKAQEQQRMAWE